MGLKGIHFIVEPRAPTTIFSVDQSPIKRALGLGLAHLDAWRLVKTATAAISRMVAILHEKRPWSEIIGETANYSAFRSIIFKMFQAF